MSLDVVKAQGANTIEVVDGVMQAVAELRGRLPEAVSVEIVRDTSQGIRNSVRDVKRTLVEGGALTILIVFLFLGSWRSTVITGLTLPIALIGTFLVMYAFGFSINVLTLMALSICVGLLIDDAIVVRENIVRHVTMGKDHRRAALEGTREIGLAVTATTLTIVAVFLPVGFMGGIIGRFFHQFGVTVAAAVLISMFVATPTPRGITRGAASAASWRGRRTSSTAWRGATSACSRGRSATASRCWRWRRRRSSAASR